MWLWMPEKSLTSTPLIKRVGLLLPWRNIPVKPIFVVWLFQNAKICPRKFLLKKFNPSTESLHFRTVSNERDGCSWKSSLSLASATGLLNHQGHGFLFAVSYALTALLVSIFPATCPPREGPRCCSLGFTSMPRAGHPQHRVTEGGWGCNWGAWISIFHFLQRSAEFLFPSEIKISLIRLFLFCITFFHCCMIPSSCLEPNHNELSPCFQSSILWGKRKQGNHTAGTRSSFL